MPNLLQQYLKDCGEVVARHKEAYARDQEAAAFQDLKRIVAQLGMCNTLTMLADVCTEASQLEDDDWEKASILIADCADDCDLKYADADSDCTCGMTAVNCTTINPPERKTNPWCPVHGHRDADIERERQLDDRLRAGEFK